MCMLTHYTVCGYTFNPFTMKVGVFCSRLYFCNIHSCVIVIRYSANVLLLYNNNRVIYFNCISLSFLLCVDRSI